MLRTAIACVSLAMCLVAFSTSKSAQVQPTANDDLTKLVADNNEFAFDLYRQLAAKETSNIVFSPYSISTALAMTYGGARGKTAEEMAAVMRLSLPAERQHAAFGQLAKKMQSDGKANTCRLDIANSLWCKSGLAFVPDFLALMNQHYDSGLRQVNFKTESENARQRINGWVAEKTQQKILDLIKEGEVGSGTRLVLVNAIYFKDDWSVPFDKKQTKDEAFYSKPDEKKTTSMMRLSMVTGYYRGDGVQMLSVPYRDPRFSMVFVLPETADQFPTVEKDLSNGTVAAWIARLSRFIVDIRLPKFKFTPRFKLAETLANMGMSQAFSELADFQGMLQKEPSMLSQVVHQAYVEVDERGTEAAAATAVIGIQPTSAPAPLKQVQFIADRPFLALIRENTTGTVLFVARVTDPEKGS